MPCSGFVHVDIARARVSSPCPGGFCFLDIGDWVLPGIPAQGDSSSWVRVYRTGVQWVANLLYSGVLLCKLSRNECGCPQPSARGTGRTLPWLRPRGHRACACIGPMPRRLWLPGRRCLGGHLEEPMETDDGEMSNSVSLWKALGHRLSRRGWHWGLLLCLCFCGYACHSAPNDIVSGGVAKRTNTK